MPKLQLRMARSPSRFEVAALSRPLAERWSFLVVVQLPSWSPPATRCCLIAVADLPQWCVAMFQEASGDVSGLAPVKAEASLERGQGARRRSMAVLLGGRRQVVGLGF